MQSYSINTSKVVGDFDDFMERENFKPNAIRYERDDLVIWLNREKNEMEMLIETVSTFRHLWIIKRHHGENDEYWVNRAITEFNET